ncbi:EpsG family protein [Turicibacter bilis]|uniref:EpsG family protein n=1 Tax=Turicibacter bilis TaxID=2735723 RepID=UPI0031B9FF37
MIIHFLFLFLIVLISGFYQKLLDKKVIVINGEITLKSKKNLLSNAILIIIFILMILFIGLRDISIGTDTSTYVSLFWNENFGFSGIEILPSIISYIIRIFSDKYFIYLCILSLICLIGVFSNINKYYFSTQMFLFLYITSYCYLYSTSATRFFCAFSMIMLSFKYMIDNNDRKVLLFLIIASMFHTSALIFIPIYYFTKLKLNHKIMLTVTTWLLVFIICFEIIDISFLFRGELTSKYIYILENRNQIGGFSLFINIAILFFAYFYRPIITFYKKDFDFFIKLQIISIIIEFCSYAYRAIWYFKFPVWFIVPIILLNLKFNRLRKREYFIIYSLIILIYIFYYYWMLKVSLATHNFLEYKFNLMWN